MTAPKLNFPRIVARIAPTQLIEKAIVPAGKRPTVSEIPNGWIFRCDDSAPCLIKDYGDDHWLVVGADTQQEPIGEVKLPGWAEIDSIEQLTGAEIGLGTAPTTFAWHDNGQWNVSDDELRSVLASFASDDAATQVLCEFIDNIKPGTLSSIELPLLTFEPLRALSVPSPTWLLRKIDKLRETLSLPPMSGAEHSEFSNRIYALQAKHTELPGTDTTTSKPNSEFLDTFGKIATASWLEIANGDGDVCPAITGGCFFTSEYE